MFRSKKSSRIMLIVYKNISGSCCRLASKPCKKSGLGCGSHNGESAIIGAVAVMDLL
jgi:hypothetical protein